MKNLFLLLFSALLCATVLASELWSGATAFDGSDTSSTITLLTTDQIFYSSALADGEPVSLELTATDTSDSTKVAALFYDDSQTAVEGTASWNYKDSEYADFPSSDVYQLKETIVTSSSSFISVPSTLPTFSIVVTPSSSVVILSLYSLSDESRPT